MRRRSVVLLLAATAALAVAVPTSGAGGELLRALGIAKQARKKASRALSAQHFHRARAKGTVTTSSQSYVRLRGGPRLRVRVPRSGVIEVVASARFGGDSGSISLFEDGRQVAGQAAFCGPGAGALVTSPDGVSGAFGTPAAFGVVACGVNGAPGPVLFRRKPGRHTYELRYADACPCAAATFSARRLWISTRP